MRWALPQVGLAEKVAGLPEGVDTPVAEEFSDPGGLFSGGELQRPAIARPQAKDAPIVILNEPSSTLDPLAEREMCDLMGCLFADCICIVVSHRLSMVRDAAWGGGVGGTARVGAAGGASLRAIGGHRWGKQREVP